MSTCKICRLQIDERTTARYTADGDTLCSPQCVLTWREINHAW